MMKKQLISIAILFSLLLTLMSGCKKPREEAGMVAGVVEKEEEPAAGNEPPIVTNPQEQIHLPHQPVETPNENGNSAPETPNAPVEEPIPEEPGNGEPIYTPLAVEDLTAEVAYTEEMPMMPPDEPFIKGQMDFSVELFRRVAQKERCKNTLIAPFSVSMALAMTANGAEGQTEQEMLDVLGGHPMQTLNAYYLNWRLPLQNDGRATLRLANSIWMRNEQGFEVKEPFLAANAKYYGSQVFKAPFNQIGTQKMNEWVYEKTDGMIPQLIDQLRPNTMMVLINALAFDAQWEEPYNEYSVKEGIFHSLDGEEQEAQMMASAEYSYLEGEGVVGFCRDYAGGQYAFGALLPAEGTFEEYVSALDGETLLQLMQNKQSTEVRAQLPQFSSEYSVSMKELLEDMGMPTAFIGGFGKMSDEDLYIGEVLHKTVIEVNEDGTRAAAATAVEMDKAAAMLPQEEPKIVTLDRPFIYFIFDKQTNLPIFLGTLTSLQ